MRPVALITGARSPAALEIARDFAAAGYAVHMADSAAARLSRWSRTPVAVHRLAPPVQARARNRRDVAALVARLRPAIVVPSCEEIFHLAAARADGVEIGPLFAPDMVTLDRLHAKHRFNALALELGLDAPASRVITAPLGAATPLDGFVLKACYSRFGLGTLVGPDRAAAAMVRPSAAQPWLVQARVQGVEHSSYAVAVDGRVTGFVAYRSTLRLRGGAGYAFRAAEAPVSARLLDASTRIAAHLGLTGQFALDAIDDGQRAWLIECNPRATSGVHLLGGEGRLAAAMAGRAVAPPDGGARHLLPMMLSWGAADALRQRRRPRLAGRDVIGVAGDRWPVLGAVADTLGFAATALRHGLPLTGATTRDIEWNGGGA